MIKLSLLIIAALVITTIPTRTEAWVDITASINAQTAIQTAEHLERLRRAVEQIQMLQDQVSNMSSILELARESAEGLDGLNVISDFRNLWLETKEIAGDVSDIIETAGDMGSIDTSWDELFGSLNEWFEDSGDLFNDIEASSKTNAWSYSVADSYQELYQKNAEYAEAFAENARQVNEKGALRQIAEEMAHLIQLENHNMNLLAQLLKTQSVEFAQENEKRMQDILQIKREGEGIRRFITSARNTTMSVR